MAAVPMIEVWRGGLLEGTHSGHAVICRPDGQIVEAWGDPGTVIFPRSSCKMIQALPLVESGAAERAGLTDAHLALACASHGGQAMHTTAVAGWLAAIGLGEGDLRCGAHMPMHQKTRDEMVCRGEAPCQIHNNCSGKHTGFLTLARDLKAGPEYLELDHPVQKAVLAATEDMTAEAVAGSGIDGCSAPNFAVTVGGLARAMAAFAAADPGGGSRDRAMARLTHAMVAHPELVAGDGRACTDLMRAAGGRAALKTGAEAVYVGIVPEMRLGIALKITDGATRASEAAIAALVSRLGLVDAGHPAVAKHFAPMRNWRGKAVGELRLAPGFG